MARTWAIWIIAILFFVYLAAWTDRTEVSLGFVSITTGWILFAVLIILALFNLRKKFPAFPLASASTWYTLHGVGGILAMGIFWLHIGSFWPIGLYEQLLTLLFYLASLTGIFGLIFQKLFPIRLTQSGAEYIYERIPAEISEIQKNAQNLILACTQETGRDTLAAHYLETLHWFFQRPRFFFSHLLGGEKDAHWIQQKCSNLERFLNAQERGYLRKIFALADSKRKVDLHYTLQTVLKSWLLVHLPLAAALMAIILWHITVVYVYFT